MILPVRNMGFRCKITPPASLTLPSDLFFPLALAPPEFWPYVRSDGGCIRVTRADGITPLAREVSGFDRSGHGGSLFLRTAAGLDESYYLNWGNPARVEPPANSTCGKYTTWESAARFVAHGEDYSDSTVVQSAMTQNTSSIAPAKIGQGFDCAPGGTEAKVTTTYAEQLGDFTFLAWFFSAAPTAPYYERILSKNYYPYGIALCRFAAVANSWGCYFLGLNAHMVTLADNAWHLLVVTRSGTQLVVNGDGGTVTNTATVPSTALSASPLCVGWDANPTPTQTNALNGLVDEARVYNRALSAAEIAIHYANQNSPATFWTVGPAELSPLLERT